MDEFPVFSQVLFECKLNSDQKGMGCHLDKKKKLLLYQEEYLLKILFFEKFLNFFGSAEQHTGP